MTFTDCQNAITAFYLVVEICNIYCDSQEGCSVCGIAFSSWIQRFSEFCYSDEADFESRVIERLLLSHVRNFEN